MIRRCVGLSSPPLARYREPHIKHNPTVPAFRCGTELYRVITQVREGRKTRYSLLLEPTPETENYATRCLTEREWAALGYYSEAERAKKDWPKFSPGQPNVTELIAKIEMLANKVRDLELEVDRLTGRLDDAGVADG